MRYRSEERGFALAVAVFALVIIAALITGIFFAARQEMKIGEATLASQRAFSAADAGISNVIANWDMSWNNLATNATATFNGSLPSGTGTYNGTVLRLNPQLFFVEVTGTDQHNQATRTLGALSRLLVLQLALRGAVTTRDSMKIGGSSFIDGVDTNPSGWSCPAVNDTVPGIATPDASAITVSGCPGLNCVRGDPKILSDPTINDSTFLKYGDFTWSDLVGMATKIYPGSYGPASDFGPVGTATTCDKSVMDNWGDPMVPATVPGCQNYFPIIYVNGDFKATGGYGQGILIVNGDMDIQGGWQFFGPVIAKGQVSTQGTGGHFNGGLLAANINLNTFLGNAIVTYSSCAIFKALNANSPGRWLKQRSWVDLF